MALGTFDQITVDLLGAAVSAVVIDAQEVNALSINHRQTITVNAIGKQSVQQITV